jgi:hypothetical protein
MSSARRLPLPGALEQLRACERCPFRNAQVVGVVFCMGFGVQACPSWLPMSLLILEYQRADLPPITAGEAAR